MMIRAVATRGWRGARAHVEPAEIRQVDVEEHEIDREGLGDGESRLAVAGLEHLHPIVLEGDAHQLDHIRLVVGDQHGQHGARYRKPRTMAGGGLAEA